MRRLWLAAAVALAVGGCGGGDHADVRAALHAYVNGLATHDFRTACRAMTAEYERFALAEVASELGERAPTGPCEAAFAKAFKGVPPAKPPVVRITALNVTGRRATVTVRARGRSGHTILAHGDDGRWRVSCCVGAQIDRQPTATYHVPSGSMEPTFKIGAVVHVDQQAYRTAPPRRGDIVIVHPALNFDGGCANPSQGAEHLAPCGAPAEGPDPTQRFIKRVVGLPGERLSMRPDGHVLVNDRRLPEPYVRPCAAGTACNFPRPITVPPGTYYLLGDNRGESDDSRFWGPVRRAWIVGRVRQNP